MPAVTYIQYDGQAQTLELPEGSSVMQGAVDHKIIGIIAECGGCASCGTCKVEVEPEWLARLPPAGDLEASLLEDYDPTVRLSCQIKLTPELDGLVVRLPASQYG